MRYAGWQTTYVGCGRRTRASTAQRSGPWRNGRERSGNSCGGYAQVRQISTARLPGVPSAIRWDSRRTTRWGMTLRAVSHAARRRGYWRCCLLRRSGLRLSCAAVGLCRGSRPGPLDRRADTYDAMATGVATNITSKPTNHVPSMLAPPSLPAIATGSHWRRADERRLRFVVFSHGYLYAFAASGRIIISSLYSKARAASTMN